MGDGRATMGRAGTERGATEGPTTMMPMAAAVRGRTQHNNGTLSALIIGMLGAAAAVLVVAIAVVVALRKKPAPAAVAAEEVVVVVDEKRPRKEKRRRTARTNTVALAAAHQAEAPAPEPQDYTTVAKYEYSWSNAKTHCENEWTKRGELNSRMFNYCMRQGKKGHANAMHVLKKFGAHPWMATLLPAIWEQWTKRGITQYRMVGYSLKKEADKFLDYEYERKQPSFSRAKMARCESKWGGHDSRWSMTMYCYKRD